MSFTSRLDKSFKHTDVLPSTDLLKHFHLIPSAARKPLPQVHHRHSHIWLLGLFLCFEVTLEDRSQIFFTCNSFRNCLGDKEGTFLTNMALKMLWNYYFLGIETVNQRDQLKLITQHFKLVQSCSVICQQSQSRLACLLLKSGALCELMEEVEPRRLLVLR